VPNARLQKTPLARPRTSLFRPLAYTALFLCAWWAVPSALKALVRDIFHECQAPAWSALSGIGDLQEFWADRTRSKAELIESGRELARLNAAYRLRIQQADADAEDLRRIEQMLAMPPPDGWRQVHARVIRRDLDTWWHSIVIQAGSGDGLRKGDGVIFRDGVVGRVVQVHALTSIVELTSSASFRAAAHVDGDLRPVTFTGRPAPAFRDPEGTATNLPADISASAAPRRLVTSHLGGAFPDGLTIGVLDHMEREPDGLFQRSVVKLPPGLVGVEEVIVLVPILREDGGKE